MTFFLFFNTALFTIGAAGVYLGATGIDHLIVAAGMAMIALTCSLAGISNYSYNAATKRYLGMR